MMIACLTFGLTACGDDDGEVAEEPKNVLAAPTNFTLDLDSGEFSFTANDANAGYYYVRCYSVTDGKEASTYTVSSSRIQGGSTGTKTGTIDMSAFGWGDYNIKLVTYAAAGTDYTAPNPVVLSMQSGIGGKLETPELAAFYSGNTAELVIDWYSLSNYYTYQVLPVVRFDFYSDEACTTLVFSDEVDTSVLVDTIDQHPGTGGYIWGYSANATFLPLTADGSPIGYLYDAYDYTTDNLSAGTYYVTATAISPVSYSEDSNTSEAVKIVLSSGTPDASNFETSTTSSWTAPGVMGVPNATTDTSRENCGVSQTVTKKLV